MALYQNKKMKYSTTKFARIQFIIRGKFRSKLITLVTAMFFFLSLSSFGQERSVYTLKFKGGEFTPTENIDEYVKGSLNLKASIQDRSYAIIQFEKLPTEELKSRMEEKGAKVLDFITGKAFAVRLSASPDFVFMKTSGVRSVFVLDDRFKMDEGLLQGEIPEWAIKAPGTVDLNVIPFEWIPVAELSEQLKKYSASLVSENENFRLITLRVKRERLVDLVHAGWLQWMETIPPAPQDDNLPGKTLHRSNILNDGFRNLTGDSVKIGIWDGGTVGPHLDFAGRLVLAEPYSSTDHGTHVAGTMAGAGLIDPYARGMAPKASIYSYYYDGDVNAEVTSAISTYGITMTQNSWGYGNGFVDCVVKDPYNSNSRGQDINIQNNPTLVHVHSSGNSQTVCAGGWGTTTGKAAKNTLVVANVNSSDAISGSSSFGPVQDGRLKPEISGLGTSVYSTTPNNTYTAGYSGTSMATPGVSGTIAQLVQRYRQLNGYSTPPASLMKAVSCNTAKDLGVAGPDYKYGYGRINGVQAVRALESNRYKIDSVGTAGTKSFSISVPANAKRLRVMICWTDPAGAANADPALVNDLDLTVIDPSVVTWNPWVLDPALPENAATRAADHLNNIEQVTIENPASGTYFLNVDGYAVPVGATQVYSITWEIESAYIEVTYPNGRDVFAPTSTEVIYWDHLGLTGNQTIQYSLNNGASWTNISTSVSSTTSRYSWSVPSVVSSQALIRITSGALSDVSDSMFSILGSPGGLAVTAGCVSGEVSVSWSAVTNATHYDVMQLDEVAGAWNVVGSNIAGTQHFVSGLTVGNTYWFTVRSRNNTSVVVGKNAIAKSILVPSIVGSPPYVIADGPLEVCPGDTLTLTGGNVTVNDYQVDMIPYQSYTPTTDIAVTLTDDAVTAALPIGFTFNYFGNAYSQFYIGSNGIIGFNSVSLGGAYIPQFIADPALPNDLIAFVWTDLNPSSGGTITYLTTGTSPNRKLVVSYNNVNRYGSSNTVDGRIELYEGSDVIEIHSNAVSSGSNTMGLENAAGSIGVPVPGRNKSTWDITSPEALRFIPDNSTMVWQPGAVNTSSLKVTVPQNYSFSYTLNGCTFYSDTVTVTACASEVTLDVKALIQGFYRGGGKMINNLSPGTTDTLFLKLAKSTPPYSILFSDTAIVDTSGNAGFVFPSSILGNSYYLVLQHRNSLETWSAAALLISSPTMIYDFTQNANSAYGSNLCDMGDGKFAIWAGDIDRNNLIDMSDLNQVQNFIGQFLNSYHKGDLTGDNSVESADYSLIENNLPLLLQVLKP